MQEKANKILNFPIQFKDLVKKSEDEVIEEMLEGVKFKRYQEILGYRFNGELGTYELEAQRGFVNIKITFDFS